MNPLNKIMLGIGAAAALVVLIAFLYLVLTNAHLKVLLAQAQGNGAACRIANDDFAARVAAQNNAVAALQREGKARQKRAQQAERQTRKIIRAYEQAAARLTARHAQGDVCAASGQMIDDYLKEPPPAD